MCIRAVLFDFDGTLTVPGILNFAALRETLGCPRELPVLEFINSLPSSEAQTEAHRILDEFEIRAAEQSRANAGAEELILRLRSKGLKIGILSRNSLRSILRAIENFPRIRPSDFEVILSRDDEIPPKPDPASVFEAAVRMSTPPSQILVVGDYIFDIEAGCQAGSYTVFLTNGTQREAHVAGADFTIDHLGELEEILEMFCPLPLGKLPNELLDRFLDELDIKDPSLMITPGVGEDIAAVRMNDEEVLVLKSDPITFATDAIASYAVMVNVNDLATSGATPRWLTGSLLFPPGTNAAGIRKVMRDLRRVSQEQGLILCGGHTEITDAVTRPVVACQTVGTASRNGLIEKRNIRPGNHILLTKAIALEGTCILAREMPERLQSLGIHPAEIEKCRRLLYEPGISIVTEARIAVESGKVTAMHDVTEGGLATALEELSTAGRHRLKVFKDRIPLLEETRRICGRLGINLLGLIGSGSLLIACESGSSGELVDKIRQAGIDATDIGIVQEEGIGVEAVDHRGAVTEWPHFPTDEIARIFEDAATPHKKSASGRMGSGPEAKG